MAQSPWGKRPSGNGGGMRPPSGGGGGQPQMDLDALLRKAHERMRGAMGPDGGASEKRIAGMILAALAVLWLISGVYRVNPDELGVVLRFGEYQRTEGPGLNYHFPYPVESVMIPSVTTVNKVEIGGGGAVENPTIRRASAEMSYLPQNHESLMLTSDRNIVDIGFEVQWKIDGTNPQDFLFNVRDPAGSVKAVAESAMREVIGRNKLEDVLTTAQSQIAEDTKAIMQRIFDQYKAGIEVIAVNLSKPDVPDPVLGEFQDVKRAEQDKETAESVAEGYRNDIIPRAKGEAVQMVQAAEAYKNRVVAEAQGDVARFNKIYEQYVNAKDVTRKRMYLETMEAVMKGMPKVIIDESAKGTGVVPVLPLPAVSQPKASE
ncbi:MAG: FtsH protease activity modulator HflK [Alphaproteobacteria bacterium]|nr:FtsH protease activity modulator HflK [Alphaproteobacteria bacterium]